ncbi:MAG: hypothetical protein WDN69_23255 [Aliidongia sp.]
MELVIITGVKRLQELQGTTSEGWDFAASLEREMVVDHQGDRQQQGPRHRRLRQDRGSMPRASSNRRIGNRTRHLVKLVVGAMAQTVSTDYGPSISLYDIPGAGGGARTQPVLHGSRKSPWRGSVKMLQAINCVWRFIRLKAPHQYLLSALGDGERKTMGRFGIR